LIFILYIQFIPGALYYPSTEKAVKTILQLSKAKKGDTLIDLGSGDGRIVISAAQKGLKSIGYELNPILVFKSRSLIKKMNLSHLAQIKFKNFWHADFNQADIIVLYQFPQYLKKLHRLLDKKLKHSVTVISNDYPFSDKKPIRIKDKIFVYRFP
jgi:cyclopropane fatty-acyl-phospholipid synthase-like methyltransferase